VIRFQTLHNDPDSYARTGLLETEHGRVETPVFMPVGTAGAVKALPHGLLEKLDAHIILANTYHLYLRPGLEIIESLGGLHRFMSWTRPILTDSGGYQVFSHQALNHISEEGVEFKSHLDGSRHFLSPEKSVQIQYALGSDVVMAFDDCTPYPVSRLEAEASMLRSMRWASRCRDALRGDQALFGIVQGGVFPDLRSQSLEMIEDLDLPGVAIGGFSVGEPKPLMYDLLTDLAGRLPSHKPRYLMGIGTPLDIVRAVQQGIDLFDCVLPTRNARNGMLFTWNGPLRIKNAAHTKDEGPLDGSCSCEVCQRYSRAYLRHLFVAGEISASVLNSYHNLYFFLDLMKKIRESIALDSLTDLVEIVAEVYRSVGRLNAK
jgi:queuine tRNA-ribosyltransferase